MITVLTTTLTVLYRKSDISFEDKTYINEYWICLLNTSPSPRDAHESRMPSSA